MVTLAFYGKLFDDKSFRDTYFQGSTLRKGEILGHQRVGHENGHYNIVPKKRSTVPAYLVDADDSAVRRFDRYARTRGFLRQDVKARVGREEFDAQAYIKPDDVPARIGARSSVGSALASLFSF